MEQLTTYRAKGKKIDIVLLFKYDLNSNLKLFEICDGKLRDDQLKWLFSKFPVNENDMKTLWMVNEKYTKVFIIEVSPADLSFEALWNYTVTKNPEKMPKNHLISSQRNKKLNVLSKFQNT